MKSLPDIIDKQDVIAYRAERDRLQSALEELIDAYRATSAPMETIGRLSDIETAKTVIATLVNLSAHDGRISTENKRWASGIGYNAEDALKMGIIGDTIHRAHLDQLTSVIRNV